MVGQQHEGLGREQGGQSSVELGAALQASASGLAGIWRQLLFRADPRRVEAPRVLEGVAESFLFELGRSLSARKSQATDAWARTRGVLRLPLEHGAAEVDAEFDLLRTVVDRFLADQAAPAPLRRKVHAALDITRLLVVAELARRVDPNQPPPRVPFGGVIVEIFPVRTRH